MKSRIIYFCLASVLALVINACYYDEVATIEGLPQNVSFKNDVVPIFNKNCNSSGCHDATPSHEPSLTSEQAYNALINGNYINTIDPEGSSLHLEISSGGMPPSGPLSSIDQKIILGWITEGAKNN